MRPIFLPSAALDAINELGQAAPSVERIKRLQELRDEAQASGAHVLLLIWPTLDWALLAIEVPEDVVIQDAVQLVPNVLANPDALEQMHEKARQGRNLTWLKLERRPASIH
ncbi:hypothetical protein LK03_02210 [Pseudomonas cremoricolorata]|uniref:Uncharacterized protein n=1 Tax=Pseudomonas cremoricolorata TaxID=157783 RepID=A0A089WFV4_9PSED|nr:hypothetical protein LK03_02210 [Pseudomonas cremoricolorata]